MEDFFKDIPKKWLLLGVILFPSSIAIIADLALPNFNLMSEIFSVIWNTVISLFTSIVGILTRLIEALQIGRG